MARNFTATFLIPIVFIANQADARKVPNWTYEQLLNESDIVIIARIESQVTAASSNEEMRGFKAIECLTTCKTEATLKGESLNDLVVQHYLLDDTGLVKGSVSGPLLGTLSSDKAYLLFLKKDKAGRWSPTSGHFDSAFSFKLLDDASRK